MQNSSKYNNLKKMFIKENEMIRKMYQFANVSELDMDMYIEEAIEEAFKNRAKVKRPISDLYKENIIKLLNSHVRYQILSDNGFSILLKYIDQEIKPSEAYEECINNLDKFLNFLSLMQYNAKEETFIELINKSQILKSILETITLTKLDSISKNKFKISENKEVNKLIKLFCRTFISPTDTKEQTESPPSKLDIKAEEANNDEEDTTDDLNYINIQAELESYQEVLTPEQERDLFIRYSNGEHQCQDIIFEMNRNLVRMIAHKNKNRGIEYDDIEQEGNVGLIIAIQRFDYKKGYRLSTFAVPYIEGRIKKLILRKSNPIKISRSLNEDKRKIDITSNILTKKLGRTPSIEEISEETNLSVERINEVFALPQVLSLDEKVYDDSNITIGEITSDLNYDITDELDKKQIKEDVLYGIENSGLSSRQIKILKLRYGLIDGEKHTQMEIAQMIGISQVQVSRDESKALKKMREYSKVTGLYYTAQESLGINEKKEYPSETKKYLWEILSISKAGTKRLISQMSKSDKEELEKFFGKSFSKSINLEKLSSDEKELLSELLKILKDISIKEYNKTNKTIYQLLSQYPKDKIDEAISLLDEEEKELLKLKYGDNLEKPTFNPNFTEEDEERFNSIVLSKLKLILENLDKYKRYKEVKTKKEGSLYELLSKYTKEEIDEAISRLSDEDKNNLLRIYGTNLNNEALPSSINEIYQLMKKIEILISSPKLSYANNEKDLGEVLDENLSIITGKKAQLLKIVKQIPKIERNTLYIKYGIYLINNAPSRPLSYEEHCLIFTTVIPRLKNLLNGKRVQLNKSIQELCPNYTRKEIIKAIENLPEEEKKIVYLKYGSHLENKISDYRLSKEQNKCFYNIILHKIRKQINNNFKKNRRTIYYYFKKYSKEEVDLAIKQLSEEELTILKQKCGEDLLGQDQEITISEEVNKKFYTIIVKVRGIINGKSTKKINYNQKITELFPEYTLEEIKDAVSRLITAQKEIVYLKYGKDLNEINNDKLSLKQKSYFNTYIKKRIKVLLENKELKFKSAFYDYFENTPKEKIDECIMNLSDQDKELFYSVYTEDLELKQNYENSNYILVQSNIKSKIRKKLNYDNKYIHEILGNYPINLIEYVINNKLSEESKELIYKLFGKNLEKPLNACSLTPSQAQSLLKGIIPKIKSILKKEENLRITLKFIQNVFENNTLEEIKIAIKRLKPNYKNIVYSKYGNDLTKENQSIETDDIFCEEIMPSIKYLLKHPEENLYINLYNYFKNNTKEEVDEAVSELNIDEKVIIALLDIDDDGTISYCSPNEIKEFEKRIVPQLQKILSGKIIRKKNQSLNDNPVLKRLSYELPKREFDVLLLYINHSNRLTTSQIAKILNMDESEVIQVAQKTLTQYKEYINHMINQTIESIEDCSKNLKPNSAE